MWNNRDVFRFDVESYFFRRNRFCFAPKIRFSHHYTCTKHLTYIIFCTDVRIHYTAHHLRTENCSPGIRKKQWMSTTFMLFSIQNSNCHGKIKAGLSVNTFFDLLFYFSRKSMNNSKRIWSNEKVWNRNLWVIVFGRRSV